MKVITPLLLAPLLLAASPNSAAHPSFDDLRAVLDGQVELLERLKPDFPSDTSFHLVAGTAMARSGRHDEAAAFYRKAAEAGSGIAVRALAQHFTDAGDHVAGYAWSYLAMQLVPEAQEMEIEDWRPRWEFQTAAENARELGNDQSREADRLSAELIAELLPVLRTDSSEAIRNGDERCMDIEVGKRKPPFYPRGMATARKTGWSHVYLLIEPDGSVSDAVPIAGTHRQFDRAARKAIRKWQFETTLNGDCDPTFGVQTIEFSLNGI